MAPPEIEVELRGAITRRKKKPPLPVRRENVALTSNGQSRLLNLEVSILSAPSLRERCFIVPLLRKLPPPAASPSARSAAEKPLPANGRVIQLETGIAAGKEHLQSVLEEHGGHQ